MMGYQADLGQRVTGEHFMMKNDASKILMEMDQKEAIKLVEERGRDGTTTASSAKESEFRFG